MTQVPRIGRSVLWLLVAAASGLSMTYYVTRVWSANQPPHFSDLYAPWWAAHELLLNHRDPYSPAVAHEIQSMIYGATVQATADDPLGVGGGFAYPPYTAFMLWPTLYLQFSGARVVFLWVSLVVTLTSLGLWVGAFQFRPPPLELLTVAVFTLGSFPALQAIRLQNLSPIAACLIALAMFSLTRDRQILAGVALAASTFKPQFVVVLIPWLAVWALSHWPQRRRLVGSFLATMLLLTVASEWILPGWVRSFVNITRAYRHYTYGHSLLDVWFTPTLGPVVAGGLLLAGLALCWSERSQPANSPSFYLIVSLVLAATLVVIPTLAPHAQLLLLPGFLCLLRYRALFLASGRLGRTLMVAAWALLAWQWAAAAVLLVAAIWMPEEALLRWWQVPLYTSPLIPFGLLAALAWLVRSRERNADSARAA